MKEGGLTPEILAHQISLVRLDAAWPRLAQPLDAAELRRFQEALSAGIARQAFPAPPSA